MSAGIFQNIEFQNAKRGGCANGKHANVNSILSATLYTVHSTLNEF